MASFGVLATASAQPADINAVNKAFQDHYARGNYSAAQIEAQELERLAKARCLNSISALLKLLIRHLLFLFAFVRQSFLPQTISPSPELQDLGLAFISDPRRHIRQIPSIRILRNCRRRFSLEVADEYVATADQDRASRSEEVRIQLVNGPPRIRLQERGCAELCTREHVALRRRSNPGTRTLSNSKGRPGVFPMFDMRRRKFIALLGSAAALPSIDRQLAARAQHIGAAPPRTFHVAAHGNDVLGNQDAVQVYIPSYLEGHQ